MNCDKTQLWTSCLLNLLLIFLTSWAIFLLSSLLILFWLILLPLSTIIIIIIIVWYKLHRLGIITFQRTLYIFWSKSFQPVSLWEWRDLSRITKDAAQPDRVKGFLRAPLEATLWLMSDHGAQLWWKGQGDNPNPPCQHSIQFVKTNYRIKTRNNHKFWQLGANLMKK
jgi:hypothetical protein